jgi:acyl carrier protein
MTIETNEAREAVRGWLREHVSPNLPESDGYDLIGNGLLTSLQTVELVLFLDERFGIEIGDDEFVEENFCSVDAITALVMSERG